jgi:2-oxoglutarate dehydrogenase complex, dehydrogenase (E1) component, and related enzymes
VLKHPQAKSTVQEFTEGTKFNPFYVHTGQCSLEDAEVAFFCSGKISYDIKAFLKNNPELEKKAVLFTIEELLPFPEKELKAEMQKLKKTCKVKF